MQYLIFFVIVFLIFSLTNWYIGVRSWQALMAWFPAADHRIFIGVFCLLSFSYLLGRVGARFLPGAAANFMTIAGSYWMAVMFYGFLILLFIDILRLVNHFTGLVTPDIIILKILGAAVLLVIVSIIGLGAWNARHPVVTHYDVTISKQAGNMESVKIVMVSDIHAGLILNNGRLAGLVDLINAQNPDVVLLAGDMIDEDVTLFAEEKMAENFCRLQAPLGVFACLGNHEYYAGNVSDIEQYLKRGQVVLLRDQTAEIAPGIVVVGRENAEQRIEGSAELVSLEDILTGIDKNKTLIALDHIPSRLGEAQSAGVDLLLCGHTHDGQLWPNNYLTSKIFPISYGYLQNGAFNAIVSSGFGTWGPPVRVGNRAEIVDITVHFE